MRTFIIDGYNLLHQIPELNEDKSEELEFRRERLINRLISFSAGRRIQIRMIFDTSRVRGGRENHPGIHVEYASPSADAYIRRIIAKNQESKSLVIVSSDRKDIGNFAQIHGLKWMTSQEFWRWIADGPKKNLQAQASGIEDTGAAPPGWTEEENARLKRIFESENGNEANENS